MMNSLAWSDFARKPTCRVCFNVADPRKRKNVHDAEPQPGLLRHMVEKTDWNLECFRTAGAFERRDLSEERDWLRELNGNEGSGMSCTTDPHGRPIVAAGQPS